MKSQRTSSATILLVDDDPNNLGVLHQSLVRQGFTVLLSQNGKRAIEQAEAEQPDLILLDVLMPDIDGFETCRILKSNSATRDIPVLFLTALSDTIDEVNGFAVGGADYILKPFRQETVLARIQAHLTIRQQQRELQELNTTKDKFFSIIAHDLKGPIGTLRDLNQHIVTNFLDLHRDELHEMFTLQHSATENLYALLSNLLTWSRMKRGIFKYHPQEVALAMIITRNVQLLQPHASQKDITLNTDLALQTPHAYGDTNMIDTIIRNIIANAVKFTYPGGHVNIRVETQSRDFRISVSDTGIGIAEEHIPKLFRVDARHRQIGTGGEEGTGLGLVLCKEFVEKNGGSIWCESEFRKGSTFSFTLPVFQPEIHNMAPEFYE